MSYDFSYYDHNQNPNSHCKNQHVLNFYETGKEDKQKKPSYEIDNMQLTQERKESSTNGTYNKCSNVKQINVDTPHTRHKSTQRTALN